MGGKRYQKKVRGGVLDGSREILRAITLLKSIPNEMTS